MNKIWAYTFLLGMFFFLHPDAHLFANNPEKTFQKAHRYWENDQLDSAVFYYQIAREEATAEGNWEIWVKTTEKMGRALSDQGQFEPAKTALDSAILIGTEKLGEGHLATLNAMSQLGLYYQYFGEYQKSLDQQLKVFEALKQNPETHDTIYAGAYERLSISYVYVEEFEKSYELAQRGVELLAPHMPSNSEKIGIFQNTLGALSAELGRNEDALVHYEKALEIFLAKYDSSNSRIITIIGNMGNLAMDEMDYLTSYDYFSSVLPYLDEAPVLTQAINLYNLGLVLNLIGDYEQGTIYLEEARNRLNIAPEAYLPQLATIEFEIARGMTESGNFEEAIKQLNLALGLYRQLEGGYLSSVSNGLLLMGVILHEQEKFAEAYEVLLESRETFIEVYGENHPQIATTDIQIGQALLALEEIPEAREYFQNAIAIYRETLPIDHPYLNEALIELAITYRVTEDFDQGIDLCREAAEAMTGIKLNTDIFTEGQFEAYWTMIKMDKILSEYAILLKEKYKKLGNIEDLEKASILFKETLAIIDSMRHTFQTSSSKSEIIREYDYVYEQAIDTEFLLYKETQSSKSLERAFSIVGKTKSRNLIEELWRKESMNFVNVPDSILERDRILKRRLDYFKTEIEDSDTISESMQARYYQTHKEYQKLLQKLETEYPEYYDLKYPANTYASFIAEYLQPGQIAYNYFWGKKQLFIFRHYQGKTDFYEMSLDTELDSILNTWLSFINTPPDEEKSVKPALAASYQLYHYLLPNLPDSVTNILVFPDGKLGYLPIESLLTQAPEEETDYRKLSFLVKKHSVIYAYSTNVWAEYADLKVKTHQLEYLGFAPVFGSGQANATTRSAMTFAELDPLIFNQDEVKLGADLFKGKAFMGEEVNEDLLTNDIEQTILHFATHAQVDQENPLNSQLFLSLPIDKEDDGILHGYEIYNLRLNSPLVILSACETGTGTFRRGEGIMSLARAFQYAGSKTIISSLWRAEDQAAYKIISSFLTNLKGGNNKSLSLQRAQKEWISDADAYFAHPYFWAGFVNIGELEVEESADPTYLLWGLGMIILLGIVGGWFFRRYFLSLGTTS